MRSERGQGTVEAALVIPIVFILLLLLMQPAIILYDRIVMSGTAAETCRLLATASSAYGPTTASCEAFARHRLSAVPQHDCFHMGGSAGWVLEMEGGESSETATVRISTDLKPLPLIGAGAQALGLTNGSGCFTVTAEAHAATQPAWAGSSVSGLDPASWPGAWLT